MSDLPDPPRILESAEDLPAFLREGLEAERINPGPDANHLDELAKKLPGALQTPASTASGSLARPSLVVALAGASILGLVALAVSIRSESAAAPVVTRAVAPPATITPASPAPPTENAPRTYRLDELPTAKVASSVSRSPGVRATSPLPSAPRVVATESAEIDLLARAQEARHTRPAETLALCQKHETEFANGRFVQEREALAIEALLYLQRRSEAERRWASFQQRYPASSHRTHLDDLFATTATPAP